jgi:hypothetical protein
MAPADSQAPSLAPALLWEQSMPALALSLAAVLLCGALTACADKPQRPAIPVAPSYEEFDPDQFDHGSRRRETIHI